MGIKFCLRRSRSRTYIYISAHISSEYVNHRNLSNLFIILLKWHIPLGCKSLTSSRWDLNFRHIFVFELPMLHWLKFLAPFRWNLRMVLNRIEPLCKQRQFYMLIYALTYEACSTEVLSQIPFRRSQNFKPIMHQQFEHENVPRFRFHPDFARHLYPSRIDTRSTDHGVYVTRNTEQFFGNILRHLKNI